MRHYPLFDRVMFGIALVFFTALLVATFWFFNL